MRCWRSSNDVLENSSKTMNTTGGGAALALPARSCPLVETARASATPPIPSAARIAIDQVLDTAAHAEGSGGGAGLGPWTAGDGAAGHAIDHRLGVGRHGRQVGRPARSARSQGVGPQGAADPGAGLAGDRPLELGVERALGEDGLDSLPPYLAYQPFGVARRRLGLAREGGNQRADDRHPVATREVGEGVVRRDGLAAGFGDLCHARGDPAVEPAQPGLVRPRPPLVQQTAAGIGRGQRTEDRRHRQLGVARVLPPVRVAPDRPNRVGQPDDPRAAARVADHAAEPSTERPGKRSLLFAGLHVGALWSLAVAEPLFDLIRKNPDFLAARGLQGGDVVLFALALALAPPLILWGLEALAWLIDHRAQRALHLLFIAALAGLIAIQALKKTSLDGSVAVIALSAVIRGAAPPLYSRAAPVRSFVTVLSPAPLVFLLLFLFISPIKDLVLPAGASASDVQVSGSVPVVMVVFDEVTTPALEDAHGRIDPVLYPNLASLARNGTWFRYATAPTDETTTATPAIMTGSLPKRHGLPILSQYPHNLFTLLGRSYRMIVSKEATDLCPRNLCQEPTRGSLAQRERSLASDTGLVYLHMIAPPHIESDLASVSSTLGGFAGDNGRTRVATPVEKHTGRTPVLHELAGGRPERFERLGGAIERRPLKTLYFKHSLLPHGPFQYP